MYRTAFELIRKMPVEIDRLIMLVIVGSIGENIVLRELWKKE